MADPTRPQPAGGSQHALRRANEHRVIEILRRDGARSQAHIARRTGLSKSAVNNIVKALRADGVVDIREGANARETTVSLVASGGTIIAVDLGHQRIHAAVICFDTGRRIDQLIDLDREHEAGTDVRMLADVIERLLTCADVDRKAILGVCVGVHAPFDTTTGTISPSAILPGWEGLNVGEALQTQLRMNVHVDNDANLGALAEWTWGAGRGVNDLLYVKSSNGIGSGLILNGAVYRGATGMAGELGHVVVDDRGALCNCGNRGCLSAVASGRSLLTQLRAAGNERTSLRDIIHAARAGDAVCARVLADAGSYLGKALAQTVKVVAPGAIVIGGELGSAGSLVFDAVRATLEANTLRTATPLPIRAGSLLGDTCILGCVAHVLGRHGQGISDIPPWILQPDCGPRTGVTGSSDGQPEAAA